MFSHLSFSREKLCQKISLFSLFGLALLCSTKVSALSDGDLQRAIVDSKALGDMGASVKSNGTTAVVSTYRAGGDSDNKCKIKAVLIAKTLMDRVKTLALVRCSFVDPANRAHCIVLDIGTGAIEAFGSGRTSQQKLLNSIPVHEQNAGASSASSASVSHAASATDANLGIVIKGKMMLTDRQNQLRHLQILQNSNQNITPVLKEFQMEDVAEDKGDITALTDHFNTVNHMIEALYNKANRQGMPSASPVKAGDFQGERTTLWKKIMDLRKSGIDTSKLDTEFQAIEGYVGKEGEDKDLLREMIASLYRKLP